MAQVDHYVAGFLAQKDGVSEKGNPFPVADQPSHATWWSGWKRAETATAVGREGADRARTEYIVIHGAA